MGVLSLITLTPLVMAGLILFIPSISKGLMRLLSLVAALVVLGGSIFVCVQYQPALGGIQFREYTALIPSLGIAWKLGVDGWGIALIVLSALLTFACVFSAWTRDDRPKKFYVLLLCLVSGAVGLFVCLDLFVFLLLYQMAVLPMYVLIGAWGHGHDIKRAGPFGALWDRLPIGDTNTSAMKATLMVFMGSLLVFAVFLGMVSEAGGQNWDLEYLQAYEYSQSFQQWAFPALWVGFGVLAGLFPFHTWCPDGHAAAPTAASMLHAGLLMKLGAFGLIRIGMVCLPDGAAEWAYIVGCVAVFSILWGALNALAQKELKYAIAYTSVSHMGLVFLGAATMTQAGWNGAIYQMVAHGLFIGLLYAVTGIVYQRIPNRTISDMNGLSERMPAAAIVFTVSGLAAFGLPGTATFVSELQLFIGIYESNEGWWLIPALCGIVIAAITLFRIIQQVFWSAPTDAQGAEVMDVRGVEWVALIVLASALLVFGLYPQFLMKYVDATTAPFLSKLLPSVLGGLY